MAWPPLHWMRVPSCSTVPLLKPSIPVQKAAREFPEQMPWGSVQLPVTLLYVPDVFVSV